MIKFLGLVSFAFFTLNFSTERLPFLIIKKVFINKYNDTIKYEQINLIENELFLKGLEIIQDSMFIRYNCSEFNFIDVSVFSPKTSELSFVKLKVMYSNELKLFFNLEKGEGFDYVVFTLKGVNFRVSKSLFDKLNLKYTDLKAPFVINKKALKIKKGCAKNLEKSQKKGNYISLKIEFNRNTGDRSFHFLEYNIINFKEW